MSANPMHDAMTRNESPRAPDNAHLMCDRATKDSRVSISGHSSRNCCSPLFQRLGFPSRREKPNLISQRLSGFEGVSDALLGFALAAEGDKGLAFEVQQVLL